MIYCVTGKPGSGKTYALVRLCKEFLESGIDVYSNIPIDIAKLDLKPKIRLFKKNKNLGICYFWENLKEFRYINNGVILIDEAGAYFEAREWNNFSSYDRIKFQQHRKQKLDIYLAVQNFNRLDTTIRQLSNIVITTTKIGKLLINTYLLPEEYNLKNSKTLERKFYLFDKKIASAYNTYLQINYPQNEFEYQFKLMTNILKSKKI